MKHPVDVHVGKRVRHRRWIVGMTEQQLGDIVGIKFQQIQKYETGMNRISASGCGISPGARGLDQLLLEGFDEPENAADATAAGLAEATARRPARRQGGAELVRSYYAIRRRSAAVCSTWRGSQRRA